MLILPSKPGAKPCKPAEYLAMVIGACMAVMIPLMLVQPIPTRESLETFDASHTPIEVTGTDYYTLLIRVSPDTQLRDLNVQKDTVDELRALTAAGRERITVLSAPNGFYFAHLWGQPRNDRIIMELTVGKHVVISYEESAAGMKATRWQGVTVITVSLSFIVWMLVKRIRSHAFAAQAAS